MKKRLLPGLILLFSPLLSLAICAPTPAGNSSEFNDITIKPVTQRPCLLVDPADLPEVKRRFESMSGQAGQDGVKSYATVHALLLGNDEEKKAATAEFV